MNTSSPKPDVERRKLTKRERRAQDKELATERAIQLRRRADSAVAIFGTHAPIVTEFRSTADLLDRIAGDL